MKNLRILISLIMLACITLLQAGCWDQKIYEKIGFILQIGLEFDENGKVLYTASVPVILPEATEKSEILSTTITHMREGRDKIRMISGKTVEAGKLQQLFFSEELAHKGISEFMELFLRSPENTLLANVVVVEGSPKELMTLAKDFKDKPRPTFYVNALLDSAQRGSSTPETRISHFTILTHSGTIDPLAPLISYNRKEIKIAGAALFDGDKMVGKLDTEDMGLLNGLMGINRSITYNYHGPHSSKSPSDLVSGAAIVMKTRNRKIDISFDGETPVINIKLVFKGYISEYSGDLDLGNPEDKKRLENMISQSIDKDCEKLLNYLTKVNSDPVGFGEIIRSKHNEYWKSHKWKDEYKDASFKVESKINIEFYGAMTNP